MSSDLHPTLFECVDGRGGDGAIGGPKGLERSQGSEGLIFSVGRGSVGAAKARPGAHLVENEVYRETCEWLATQPWPQSVVVRLVVIAQATYTAQARTSRRAHPIPMTEAPFVRTAADIEAVEACWTRGAHRCSYIHSLTAHGGRGLVEVSWR